MNQSMKPKNAARNKPATIPQNKIEKHFDSTDKLTAVIVVIGALLASAFGSDQYHLPMVAAVFVTICVALFDLFRHLPLRKRWYIYALLILATAAICTIWQIDHQPINASNPIIVTSFTQQQIPPEEAVKTPSTTTEKKPPLVNKKFTPPYIALKEAQLLNVALGEKPVAKLIFKNTGSTPAVNVKLNTHFINRLEPLSDSYNPSDTNNDVSVGYFAPGAENQQINYGKVTTQEWLDAFNSKKLYIYIWGTFNYSEVDGKSHYLNFCGEYNHSSGIFEYCTFHNEYK